MIGKWFCAALMPWALATAAEALPNDDPEVAADLRCLAIAFNMAGSQDAQLSQAGALAAYYYLGKIDGRAPAIDLEDAIRRSSSSPSAGQFAAEAQRCGDELQTRGREITDIGLRLQNTGD
jgi:hypothetical protein